MSESDSSSSQPSVVDSGTEVVSQKTMAITTPENKNKNVNRTAESPATPDAKTAEVKIELILKAIGDTPIMKKSKWMVQSSRTVGWLLSFCTTYLKLSPRETLYLYVNQSYSPAPDEVLENLYNCFGSDNNLTIHYSLSLAWG